MEGNGSGRLDRIEALLDKLAERQREFQVIQEHDHEEFKRDHQQLMTWQVVMQDKIDRFSSDRDAERKRLDELWANTDKRISDLVGAISS